MQVTIQKTPKSRLSEVDFDNLAFGRSFADHMLVAEYADGTGTRVAYDLAVELVIPLPGFVKRRAEMRILSTLKELKTRSES